MVNVCFRCLDDLKCFVVFLVFDLIWFLPFLGVILFMDHLIELMYCWMCFSKIFSVIKEKIIFGIKFIVRFKTINERNKLFDQAFECVSLSCLTSFFCLNFWDITNKPEKLDFIYYYLWVNYLNIIYCLHVYHYFYYRNIILIMGILFNH